MATTIKSNVAIIKQRINKDVVLFLSENETYEIDNLLLTAATPAICMNLKKANPKDMNRIMLSISRFLKKYPRFQNLTKEAVKKGLAEEWVKNFDDETKYEMLSELPVISGFDEDGFAIKDNKFFDTYLKCYFAPLEYGKQLYDTVQTKKRAPKEILLNVDPDVDMAKKLAPYIAWYKRWWKYMVRHESYKWRATDQFQKTFDINAQNLAGNLKEALSLEENLLSGPMNFSKDMLLKNAECSPQETKSALVMLFDESLDLAQRADDFIDQFNSIHEFNKSQGLLKSNTTPHQNPHSVSVYLAFAHPSQHYIYKETVWLDFRYETDLDYPPLSRFAHKLVGYDQICNHIREVLISDKELKALHDDSYPSDKSDYHLLTQDFIYAIGVHFIDFDKRPAYFEEGEDEDK